MEKKILAITSGDPNGIGGEVFLKSWLALSTSGLASATSGLASGSVSLNESSASSSSSATSGSVSSTESAPAFSGDAHHCLLLDDPSRVKKLIDFLGLPITTTIVQDAAAIKEHFSRPSNDLAILPILPAGEKINFHLGAPQDKTARKASALAAMASLDTAIDLIDKKIVHGMVTSPLDKSIINAIAPGFVGHTDYLAKKNNAKNHAMMLLAEEAGDNKNYNRNGDNKNYNRNGENENRNGNRSHHNGNRNRNSDNQKSSSFFCTVPLTTHIPLRDVAKKITPALLQDTAHLVAMELRQKFSIDNPRIAVAGINPHAGDGGIMGREEIDVMLLAIKELQTAGLNVEGPLAADSLFTPMMRQQYDVFLCPSHDQALIPMKTLFFDRAVNWTLGLSYIRVSPDHGTGFAIADKKSANHLSMLSAITLALSLIKKS